MMVAKMTMTGTNDCDVSPGSIEKFKVIPAKYSV